jgi:hypothetical protein
MENTINIIKCSEIIDNWGNTEQYKGAELYKLLITPEDWSDDQTFISDNEATYFIDDLIGKEVQVGTFIFTVQEYEE